MSTGKIHLVILSPSIRPVEDLRSGSSDKLREGSRDSSSPRPSGTPQNDIRKKGFPDGHQADVYNLGIKRFCTLLNYFNIIPLYNKFSLKPNITSSVPARYEDNPVQLLS